VRRQDVVVPLMRIITHASCRLVCDQVIGMSDMTRVAPALGVIGSSFASVQPALCARINECISAARIQIEMAALR